MTNPKSPRAIQIEKQVCSLELAKRLKELGVKQDSVFSWLNNDHHGTDNWYVFLTHYEYLIEVPEYAAFTVAELGDMLRCTFETFFGGRLWYVTMVTSGKQWEADTEANARAKMLIYLLENKLITA